MHIDLSTAQLRDDSIKYLDFYANQANDLKDKLKDVLNSPTEMTGGKSEPIPPACTNGLEELISRVENLSGAPTQSPVSATSSIAKAMLLNSQATAAQQDAIYWDMVATDLEATLNSLDSIMGAAKGY
jgi:hypothetical protein